jgi:alpha-L-fucosidase
MFRILIALSVIVASSFAVQAPPPAHRATPTVEQRAWQDLAMGMFIHFAPNTWQDREYDDLSTPPSAIDPAKLDTDQWVGAAIKMGAKYVVIVAKHAGGFCLWQTATTDYGVRTAAWRGGKGDVLADLAASCRRRGIALGVYLSPQDAKQGAGTGGRCKTSEAQEAYNRLYREQLTEVLTKYGRMVEVWFDGSLVVPVGDILQKHAPGAMVFQGPHATIRWVGNEDGFAPYPAWNGLSASDARTGIATAMHGDPDGDTWRPNEVDVSLRRPNWFWSTTNHTRILTLDQLMEIYYRSVGRGANLLLNVTPDRTGLIPAADVTRLEEFGDEVRRRFGHAIAERAGSGAAVELRLNAPTAIDHVVLQEDTALGERVREYALEGRAGGAWLPLGSGTAIGQMRIQPVEPRTVEAIRLRVTRTAVQPPTIRRLAVFATHAAPPKTWNDQARVWSADSVGRWKDGAAALDLTKTIDAAGQYRVRLVAEGGTRFSIVSAEVSISGVAQPHLLAPDKTRPDTLILTVPGLGQPIELRVRVEGAPLGTVLLQKM